MHVSARGRTWTLCVALSLTIATYSGAQFGTHASADPAAPRNDSVLPNGWLLRPPQGMFRETDTMPQGAAASPNGKILAVVDSGFNPASLRLYNAADLK